MTRNTFFVASEAPELSAPERSEKRRAADAGLGWVEQTIELTSHIRARPMAQLALALAAFAVALGARFASEGYLPPGFPYLTFFPAVVLCGFLGGVASGAICAALSGVAAWWWFMPPQGAFKMGGATIVALVFYVVIISVELGLLHLLTQAILQTNQKRQETDRLLAHQRALFSELQHRVANNLAFVSALFGMQKRKAAGNPEAVAAFEDARMRLDTMGRLHRRLYDPLNANLPLDVFLRELLNDMLQGAGAENVRVDVATERIELPVETTMTLALVVAEIATNSLKHAFKDGASGVIGVRLTREPLGQARLVVRDDGPGWPEGGPSASSKSLGVRIIKSFAVNLKAKIAFENDGGAVIILTFPIPVEA
jgi:two-component sensor histidine kinase